MGARKRKKHLKKIWKGVKKKKPNFKYSERIAGIIIIKEFFSPYFLSQEV